MVDHIMTKLAVPYNDKEKGYYIVPSKDDIFFEDRQAHLYVLGQKAGVFGIVHPKVLKNFEIKYPVSLAELDMEYIFELIIKGVLLKSH
jgi:phenylalanyl-tRNA synthetase beta chain